MLDTANSNRPERRPALVAHELSRLNIDIAALSEVRFVDDGSLKEHSARYTLFCSGKQPNERRQLEVRLMVRNSIATKLDGLPTGHTDRTMSMRLPLEGRQHLTLFSVYAPILLADPADKDSFHSDLRRLLYSTQYVDDLSQQVFADKFQLNEDEFKEFRISFA